MKKQWMAPNRSGSRCSAGYVLCWQVVRAESACKCEKRSTMFHSLLVAHGRDGPCLFGRGRSIWFSKSGSGRTPMRRRCAGGSCWCRAMASATRHYLYRRCRAFGAQSAPLGRGVCDFPLVFGAEVLKKWKDCHKSRCAPARHMRSTPCEWHVGGPLYRLPRIAPPRRVFDTATLRADKLWNADDGPYLGHP